jgi:uncharacterized membrane protein YedE/YeeE
MPLLVASFACGVLFGIGLVVSGMSQPTKVLGFLDLFGRWDPTLAIVMAAALAVAYPGYALARRRAEPFCAPACQWPTNRVIDRRLIAGSALFGVGWGLVGLCPGPALVNLASLSPRIVIFVAAMALGMVLYGSWSARKPAAPVPIPELATPARSDG